MTIPNHNKQLPFIYARELLVNDHMAQYRKTVLSRWWTGNVARLRNVHNIERNNLLGKYECSWEDNIKIDLRILKPFFATVCSRFKCLRIEAGWFAVKLSATLPFHVSAVIIHIIFMKHRLSVCVICKCWLMIVCC